MLRIKIELVPNGREEQTKVLGTVRIVNDSTGSIDVGNYIYEVTEFDDIGCGLCQGIILEQGRVWNHKRSDSFWVLISKIISKMNFIKESSNHNERKNNNVF